MSSLASSLHRALSTTPVPTAARERCWAKLQREIRATQTPAKNSNKRGRQPVEKPDPNPSGLCMCACGRTTPVADRHRPDKGHVRGCHTLYCPGHGARTAQPEYVIDEATGCWVWQRATTSEGYGVAHRPSDRVTMPVHRLIWERLNGPVPRDRHLHHTCLNKLCCNPDHLQLLTNDDHQALHVRLRRVSAGKPGEPNSPGQDVPPPGASHPSFVCGAAPSARPSCGPAPEGELA